MPAQLPCQIAELAVVRLAARQRGEQVTVETGDEDVERLASRRIETGFIQVFGWGLGGVKAQRGGTIELENHRQKAVAKRFGVPAFARELLRAGELLRGIVHYTAGLPT